MVTVNYKNGYILLQLLLSGDLTWWLAISVVSRSDIRFLSPAPRDVASVLNVIVILRLALFPYPQKWDGPSVQTIVWISRLMMTHTHHEDVKQSITQIMCFLGRAGWAPKLVPKWLEKAGKGDWLGVYCACGWGEVFLLPSWGRQGLNFLLAPKMKVPELS